MITIEAVFAKERMMMWGVSVGDGGGGGRGTEVGVEVGLSLELAAEPPRVLR